MGGCVSFTQQQGKGKVCRERMRDHELNHSWGVTIELLQA